MKRKIRYWIVLLSIPLLLLSGRNSYAGPEDFQLTVRNIIQTAPNILEFDVYILDTDPLNDFYLSTEQFGILFNSAIYAGGTISAAISNTGSGLGSNQLITVAPGIRTDAAFPGQTLIESIGGMAYIPFSQCTMISKSAPGTLVTHFILTSSVNFASGATPDFVFTSSSAVSPLYATIITVSDNTQTAPLTVTPGGNATVVGNPVLNAAPQQFTVTGGGNYCESGAGLPVGLSGSELGVTYTLYRGGSELAPTVPGTGSAISFGNQTAGTYTVSGTNTGGTTAMAGNAVITMTSLPAVPVFSGGATTQCSGSTGQVYTVAEVTGATSYNWTLPSGWTLTGGTGTRSITVTVGTVGGTVSVTATNSCGTGSAGTLNVTVNQTPAVSNQSTSINSGETFSVTPAGVPGGTTYTWPLPTYTGGVTGGAAQPTGVTSISGTLSISSGNGTATYTVTPASGTCVGSNFTVVVNVSTSCVPVDITVDPVNTSMCAGGNASFSVTATGTSPAYQWQYYNGATWVSVANGTPTGATYTNATTTTLNVSGITATGVFQYRCTATNCTAGSDQSLAATLTVNEIPAQPTAVVTQPTCSTATGTITVSAPTGTGMTYSIDGTTYTNTTGIFSSVIPGAYTVTARSSAGCVSPGRSVTVNAQPPTPVVGPQTSAINSGQTFTVTPTGVPTGTTYTWPAPTYTNGVTGGVAQSTGATSISGTLTIPSGNGTAIYTVTPATPTCTGTPFTVTVTVNSSCIPVDITTDPVNASICAGGNTSFSVTATGTSPAFQWQYLNGATWVSVANGTPAGATYTNATTTTLGVSGITAAGVYQYRCTATNCSVSSDQSLAATLTVNALPAQPAITADGPLAICAGEDVVLTAPDATTWLWSTGATTRSITASTAGDYWVRVTDANSCQSAQSATTTVTVNPVPATPVVGTITQPTCTEATGSVPLSGLPAGSWTVNPGNITGSASSVTVPGLTPGSYSFTVTNSNGCTSAATAPVVINTQPAVPTAPVIGTVTQPTCAVTTGSVGISGLPTPGNWTLTRSPGGAQVTGSGTSFTVTGIPAGTYTYTVTNEAGCTSPASQPFTVNAPLQVPAAPSQSVDCTLGFNHAVVTVLSPSETGLEYRLDAGSWQTSNIFSNVLNGTHTVTVRNTSGCTATGPEFSVNCGCVTPPLLTLGASSGSTCGVTAVTVTGNTFGGSATSVTITENGGGTVTPASATVSPFSFTYTPVAGDAGRVVVITVTTNNPLGTPCAAATATYSLTVNANPAAPVPGTVTHPTCAVPSGSVVLNSLPASGDWTITRSPGGQTTTGSGTSTTITGLAPGTYTFTVTNALGCISAASANVVINAQPATPTAPVVGAITQPTCALSTGSVALSGLPDAGTWNLTRTPGNVTISGTGATRTVTSIPPGTYTFTVANAAGCVSPASAEVVINPQPVTPNAPVIGTITHPTCDLATGSILLENMPETGEWTLVRYPGGSGSTGTGSSTTISSLAAGIYNFTVRNADGCTSQVSANAVINTQPPTPTALVVGTITHPTFAVPTGSVVLSGLPSAGTWTLIRYPDGFTSQGTGTTRTVSGLEPGTYTFAVTNSSGCTSAATGNVVINARPGAPVVVINNPPAICENETTDLTAPAVTAGSDQNLTFSYWTDAAATLTYATPQTASAGTYYIMGTSTAGYFTIKPVVVTADELPVAYAGADQVLEYVFGTTLDADIPEVGEGLWELVTGTGNIFNSIDPATSVSGLSAGENVFSWTVTNGACDPVSDLVVITVNNLTIPTLITPNLDGRNDYFVLRGLGTLGRTGLTIFDRRGLKVYENSDYQNDWDGTDYNSNPLPDDTYFYVIRADNGVSVSGYVVVRR